MRITTFTAIAALAITGASGTAFAKAHNQPASTADFGQSAASGQFDEPNNLDARGLLTDDEKGVDGSETSMDAKTKDTPVFDTPAMPMPDAPPEPE